MVFVLSEGGGFSGFDSSVGGVPRAMNPFTNCTARAGRSPRCPWTEVDPPGGLVGLLALRIALVKRSFCEAMTLQSLEWWDLL